MWTLFVFIALGSHSHLDTGYKSKEACEKAGKQIVAEVGTKYELGGRFTCVKKED